jgi:group I intron endonuclease
MVKNKTNNKMYIGQTIRPQARKLEHWKCGYSIKKVSYLYNAIRKYGSNNFSFSILEICDSKENVCQAEKDWIKYYNSSNRAAGYNLSSGGESGNAGHKASEETKKILSENTRGSKNPISKLSEEDVSTIRKEYANSNDPNFVIKWAKKLSVTTGCIYTDLSKRGWKHVETKFIKRKIPKSKETRNNISKSRTGNKDAVGDKNGMAKLNSSEVKIIKIEYAKNPTINTQYLLSKKFNTSRHNIYQITSGKRWKHVKISD